MKKLLVLLALVILAGCGRKGGGSNYLPPVGTPNPVDGYVTAVSVGVCISNEDGCPQTVEEQVAMYLKKGIWLMSPIQYAYAASASTSASFIPSIGGTLTLAALGSPVLTPSSGITDSVAFGQINITNYDTNNLSICGTGTQKCTSAKFRARVTSATSSGANNPITDDIRVLIGSTELDLNSAGGYDYADLTTAATIASNVNRLRASGGNAGQSVLNAVTPSRSALEIGRAHV